MKKADIAQRGDLVKIRRESQLWTRRAGRDEIEGEGQHGGGAPSWVGQRPERSGLDIYDPDCPACLRNLEHGISEHYAALRRARS